MDPTRLVRLRHTIPSQFRGREGPSGLLLKTSSFILSQSLGCVKNRHLNTYIKSQHPLIKIHQHLTILTVKSRFDPLAFKTNNLSQAPSAKFSLDKIFFFFFLFLEFWTSPKVFCYAKLFSLSDAMFALYPECLVHMHSYVLITTTGDLGITSEPEKLWCFQHNEARVWYEADAQ